MNGLTSGSGAERRGGGRNVADGTARHLPGRSAARGFPVLVLALALGTAAPVPAEQMEIAVLGEVFRLDQDVAGLDPDPGIAAGAQFDWPLAASWSALVSTRFSRQPSSQPFGDATVRQLGGGFRLYPFGMSGSPFFVQVEAGWLQLDLAERPQAVDRPFGAIAVGQRIRLDDRWSLLWEAGGRATPSDRWDPIRQRITEPGLRVGISRRLGRPDPDTDGDGVPDHADACPGTAAGAHVDAAGCPRDEDLDGVPDGLDVCPGTPRGLPVDASGCSPLRDSDGDSIPDGVDDCPGTESGQRVDARGCPTDEPMARALPPLRLQDVMFRTKSAQLPPEALPLLNEMAASLAAWPEVTVEIAGQRDPGAAAGAEELAIRRAESVRAYLVARGIPAQQLRVSPRGERAPGPRPAVTFRAEAPEPESRSGGAEAR